MPKPEKTESVVPSFETLPALTADPDFINQANQAMKWVRQKKEAEVALEKLRPVLGARVRTAAIASGLDIKSVRFLDLVITNSSGSSSPGPVNIEVLFPLLLDFFEKDWARVDRVIAGAAVVVDPQKLLSAGVPAHIIEQSRGEAKTTTGSTSLSVAK
jgi:hypothetical protein